MHGQRRRRALMGLLGLPVLALLIWAPAAAPAKGSNCLVTNPARNGSYRSLQAAQAAARVGDTLLVRGTCVGTTKISKDLTIKGQHNAKGKGQHKAKGVKSQHKPTGVAVPALNAAEPARCSRSRVASPSASTA
jgi:hypothetical protein